MMTRYEPKNTTNQAPGVGPMWVAAGLGTASFDGITGILAGDRARATA